MNVACPLFVPLAEEGWTENEVAREAAKLYLAPVVAAGARVVVLGCTHYPLLARTIAAALPEGTLLVDSAASTAVGQMSKHLEQLHAFLDEAFAA